MPKTQMVNVREFRADMTRFLKEAKDRDIHLILMRHTEPVARIVAFDAGTTLEEVVGRGAIAKEPKQGKKQPAKQAKKSGKKQMKKKPAKAGWRKMFGL